MENAIPSNSPVACDLSLSAAPACETLIGGRYRVTGLLKTDHVAEEILLATDTTTGETVVVRWLEVSNLSPSARVRMEREAEVLSKLQNPCVSRVSTIGQEGDRLYVARPYVPGINLRQRLLRAPLDGHEVLTLGRCLFSALKEIHGQGILHYDLRPVNVIVNEDSPLVAAVLAGFSLGLRPNPDMSSVGESMEAALYRSPEQAGSVDYEIGPTADLYSAGIVLFECLAGHTPFSGDNVGAVLLAHMTSRVPDLRAWGWKSLAPWTSWCSGCCARTPATDTRPPRPCCWTWRGSPHRCARTQPSRPTSWDRTTVAPR